MPTLTPELQDRAVRIADACMRSDIEIHGIGCGELSDHTYGLVDEACRPVETLDEASEALRDAFAYLHARGLAELLPETGHGQRIRLLVDRFED